LAGIRLEGSTIETNEIKVMTRLGAPIQALESKTNPKGDRPTFYGATFDYVAAPTQPIVGVIRDKHTGQPLAGVAVQIEQFAGTNYIDPGTIKTFTDKEGHYRLTGLPRGGGHRIMAVAADGQPYHRASQTVPAHEGLEPITVDFALKQGIPLTGRVLDKATGQPVHARVVYFVFKDNPHWQDVPGFATDHYLNTQPDGSFQLVAMPGRGLIGVVASPYGHYMMAVGADQIQGRDRNGIFQTYPGVCYEQTYNTVIEINPAVDAASVTCTVFVDPGQTLSGTVLGPDDKPLAGTRTRGLRSSRFANWEREPLATANFTVYAFKEGQPHRLFFLHEGRRLAGSLLLEGKEQAPVTVRLEPWGTVTGRLVDTDKVPRAGTTLRFIFPPVTGDPLVDLSIGWPPKFSFETDKEGRFRIDGLIPGLKYSLAADGGPTLFKDLVLQAGETKDLGDATAKEEE
jgi:hypothetical protein